MYSQMACALVQQAAWLEMSALVNYHQLNYWKSKMTFHHKCVY